MKVLNPFQMNDWGIKTFLILVISIQFSLWGLIGLDYIGFNIPILRQLIGFIYLTFIPGILILRILKLHELGNIDTLLYSTGLSLSTLMFIGFSMNMIYPALGITKPLSLIPLNITISIVVLSLCVVCYLRDKMYRNPKYFETEFLLSPALLSLLLIPFMTVFGTYLVNTTNNNIILMVVIVLIATVVLFTEFAKFIPSHLYPLVIWILSISLIWHYTLITDYSIVHDGEFYIAKTVIENNFWNWNIFDNYNSVLSVTILPAIIYFLSNINLTIIHKVVFPIILSFIPLCTYSISCKYLHEKLSFLAAYIVIINTEYYMLSTITKQVMAMFFLLLFFMLTLKDNVNKIQFSILSLVFSMSLIVSHYGTSYLVMISFIFIGVSLYGLKSLKFIKNDPNVTYKLISPTFILLFFVFTFSWYIYISSSSVLDSILNISSHIFSSLTDFYNPESSRGAYMLSKQYNGLKFLHKYLKLSIPFLVIVGLFHELLSFKKSKFDLIYFAFSIYYLSLQVLSVLVSYFSVMSPGRLYILGLPLLAPLGIIGGLQISKHMCNVLKSNNNSKLAALSVYLILLMLLNTQFLYVLTNDHPVSPSLSQKYITEYGDTDDKAKFYSDLIVGYDIFSLEWLDKYGRKEQNLYFTFGYSHIGSVLKNLGHFPINNIKIFNERTVSIPNKNYILLIYLNVKENIGLTTATKMKMSNYFDMKSLLLSLNNKQKIYSNGGSEILFS